MTDSKKKYRIFSIMAASLLIVLSCEVPSDTTEDTSKPNEDEEKAVATILFQEDDEGSTQFYTNDNSYYGQKFVYVSYSTYQASMDTTEIEIKKNSGHAETAYGLVFCQQNTKYYGVYINVNGEFYIEKKVSDHYVIIQDWTGPVGSLLTGYEVTNRLKVRYESSSMTFFVYFNDVLEYSFTDSTFSGGLSGYYAVVDNNDLEDFPNSPVDIRYRLLQPDN